MLIPLPHRTDILILVLSDNYLNPTGPTDNGAGVCVRKRNGQCDKYITNLESLISKSDTTAWYYFFGNSPLGVAGLR